MNETTNNVKALLLTQAQALRTQADVLEAQAKALPDGAEQGDPLLDVDAVMHEFGVGRDSLKAAEERGELELLRGARGKLLIARSVVRSWLESRKGRPRKASSTPATDLAAWEREAEQHLRALPGGRK